MQKGSFLVALPDKVESWMEKTNPQGQCSGDEGGEVGMGRGWEGGQMTEEVSCWVQLYLLEIPHISRDGEIGRAHV